MRAGEKKLTLRNFDEGVRNKLVQEALKKLSLANKADLFDKLIPKIINKGTQHASIKTTLKYDIYNVLDEHMQPELKKIETEMRQKALELVDEM